MSVKSIDNVFVENGKRTGNFLPSSVNSTLPQTHYKIHLSNISPQAFLKMPTKSVHIAAGIKQIYKNIPSYLYSYFWICPVGLFSFPFDLNCINSPKSLLKKKTQKDFLKLTKMY